MKIENYSVELQQSPEYKKYVTSLGWSVLTLDGVNIFIRNIPFLGTLAKIQRPEILPYLPKLIPLLQKNRVRLVACEPTMKTSQEEYSRWITTLSTFFKIQHSPYLQTKTIRVDVTPTEGKIFNRFSEAKRRAVRKAQKNFVTVSESRTIDDLIQIKNKSAGLFGSITTYGIEKLWNCLPYKNKAILLAKNEHTTIGGILLIFYDTISYYWIAGATKEGKKLFAPTLLIWEALKLSKKNNCTAFDFVGVFDERIPHENLSWKGFTKFKEGFGGKEFYYPVPRNPSNHPTSMLHR